MSEWYLLPFITVLVMEYDPDHNRKDGIKIILTNKYNSVGKRTIYVLKYNLECKSKQCIL